MVSRRILELFLMIALAAGVSGCNLYGGIDSPSGDAQLISAARACLDQGDFQCALDYYKRLSSASSDINNSESAYAVFDEYGATIGAFAAGFGNGKNANIGNGLTTMADTILEKGLAGSTARVAIYNAFKGADNITDNPSLQALVRFIGSIAFSAEILAEVAQNEGAATLTTAGMSSNTAVGCTGTPAASKKLEDSSITATTVAAAATQDLINAAMQSASAAISTLATSGAFTSAFNNAFVSLALSTGCTVGTPSNYNTALVTIGVGTPAQ